MFLCVWLQLFRGEGGIFDTMVDCVCDQGNQSLDNHSVSISTTLQSCLVEAFKFQFPDQGSSKRYVRSAGQPAASAPMCCQDPSRMAGPLVKLEGADAPKQFQFRSYMQVNSRFKKVVRYLSMYCLLFKLRSLYKSRRNLCLVTKKQSICIRSKSHVKLSIASLSSHTPTLHP